MIHWRDESVNLIDISVTLERNMPTWPGTPGFSLECYKRIEAGDGHNNSRLHTDTHVGTHVDAPLHFIKEGKAAEELSLDILVGPAWVAYVPNVKAVKASDLSGLPLPAKVERLLLRTGNSALWAAGEPVFQPDFVALTEDAAHWVVEKRIRLVGIDYLSVGQYENGHAVHQTLLSSEVVIVEGLNLAHVESGEYELICLPIKIAGAEGAPARAVLRPL